jgi:hypothetical protein
MQVVDPDMTDNRPNERSRLLVLRSALFFPVGVNSEA